MSNPAATFEGTPVKVLEQLRKIQTLGVGPNMMDRLGVQAAANEEDCYDLVVRVEDVGRWGYSDLLMTFGRWLEEQD